MKRILLLMVVMIMTPLIVGCEADHTEDYLSQMTALTEAEVVEGWEGYTKATYYVSHKLVLNPEEILYYAPRKLQYGETIYLNKQELFFIVSLDSGIMKTKNLREATAEELKLIFD